jgi:hypothetical protein
MAPRKNESVSKLQALFIPAPDDDCSPRRLETEFAIGE